MTGRREDWWLSGLYFDEAGYYRYEHGTMTAELFIEARRGLDRNDGPALLFDLWSAGTLDVSEHPAAVVEAWTMCEFPAAYFDPPAMWVDLFDEAGYTVDGQSAPRPTQPVTLYRGCHHDRRFGMSWTADLERARWFADRDLGLGPGLVYVTTADPKSLLAFIGDGHRRESEYVVDPTYLNDDVVAKAEVMRP